MPKPIFKTKKEVTDSMIRVDHAGEYGAMRIYQGQMAAIKDAKTKSIISHMLEQEQRHLAFFEEEMKHRKVRPTAFLPLWHIGSYTLGLITGLFGCKTAMLCTQAVEEVIDEHYAEQVVILKGDKKEEPLLSRIEQFRTEELEHKEIAIEHGSLQAPLYFFIRKSKGSWCKLAIEISKR